MNHEDSDQLVTVATFETRSELTVARGLLESEGIDCLAPEEYGKLKGSMRRGRMRLQVRSSDAERARALLESVTDENQSREENRDE